MERYFDIYLNAGNSVPVVINVNQYDASETWIFTLYTDDNQQYTPASGSIVGLKSDGHTIANAGTVNNDGQVVIQETVQITAAKGINIFELVLNGNHGTANFVVLVEPRPGDNATPSDSDLSLMQEAIEAASTVGTVGTLADEVTNLKSQMEVWLTEHAGMSNETILWEGTLTGTGSVTLSEDASQFDTIAVYTQATSLYEADTASEAHFYKASDLIANHAVVSVAVASTVSNTAIDSAIITGIVGISGTQNKTFNLIGRKGLHWSGVATDGADIILGSSGSALITKVVGIKNEQTDAEVVAARVGSDGTQYSNLKARLDAENSDLKSAIQRGSGLTAEVKQALMDIFEHIGGLYTDANARTYIENLRTALYPPTNLDSISAVYTQSGTVYASDSLNSLKADLVVTAHYSDLTTETITTYALSGTLTVGTSTITVTYGGKSTTFTVTVTSAAHGIPSDYQEVEWVKNELNSVGIWTDARNLPTAFRLEAKAQLHGYNSGGTYGNIVAVFQRGAQTYGYELAYRQATSDLTSFLGSQSNITPSDLNAVIVVGTVCNGATEQAYMVVDGERVYGDSVEVTRTYNNNGIGLFYGGATVKNQLVGRIYYVNVYDSSEELYAQFIPCYRKSDGAIGFYENVTGTFVTESTANLSKGADVL